jgi:hypothetical protein
MTHGTDPHDARVTSTPDDASAETGPDGAQAEAGPGGARVGANPPAGASSGLDPKKESAAPPPADSPSANQMETSTSVAMAPTPPSPATEGDDVLDTKGKKGKGKKKKKKKGTKDGLGTSRGIETMFRTSYRTHLNLSNLADTKANIMISINGIIISIIIASIAPGIESNWWLVFPTSVVLLSCTTSMVFAILAARPRVSSRFVSLEDVRSNRANILFFGNFVNMEEEDFLTGMREIMGNSDQLYTNMMRDIYSLGGVLSRKYALVRVSYNIFMVGLSVSVLLFVAVFALAAYTQGFSVTG